MYLISPKPKKKSNHESIFHFSHQEQFKNIYFNYKLLVIITSFSPYNNMAEELNSKCNNKSENE